jgi:sulfur-oxidizing protein SoxY
MGISRRDALRLAAGSAAVAISGASVSGAPADAAAAIAAFTGGAKAEEGGIALDLAASVEDGNSVPLSVAVESPMSADDRVTEVLIVAERNPWTGVGTFRFTPMSGRAAFSTRIRLAESQTVIVLAKTNTGRVHVARRHVEVTIGACTS